jgi:Flp pilus assembly pilin Flp
MLRLLRNKRAQSTAEYAILIGLVVAALLAMQTYVKRGLNAKMKDATDAYQTGTPGLASTTSGQYEPYYFGQSLTTGQGGSETKSLATGGQETHASDLTSTRSGTTQVGAAQ